MTRAIHSGPSGSHLLVEESHALPLIQFNLTLRTGSVFDPPGKEGLYRLCARMVRMGTRRLQSEAVEDAIDAMGAHLSIGIGPGDCHFSGSVVARNLEPFLALLGSLLSAPAFRARDLGQLKRETIAALESALDDDSALAGRHFRRLALPNHLYGRATMGTRASVTTIERSDIVKHYAKHMVGENALFGFSGPISTGQAQALCQKHFGFLVPGSRLQLDIPAPKLARGRRLFVVDKPERTQTQILIGTTGSRVKDRDHVPLVVANTAFGGLFTSLLTREVRGKRGWSYGASSGLGNQIQRDLWSMRTFPAEKDAHDCIALQLRLLEQWIERGVSSKDLRLAKDYLVKSHPFELDTSQKRLEQALDEILFELPKGYSRHFPERVAMVDKEAAHEAVKRRISARDQLIVVVATASHVVSQLQRLPNLTDVQVIPFDQGW